MEDKFISTASKVKTKDDEVYLISSYFEMENFERTYKVMYESPEVKSFSDRYKLESRIQTESLYQNSDIDLIKEALKNHELNSVQSDLFVGYVKNGDKFYKEVDGRWVECAKLNIQRWMFIWKIKNKIRKNEREKVRLQRLLNNLK